MCSIWVSLKFATTQTSLTGTISSKAVPGATSRPMRTWRLPITQPTGARTTVLSRSIWARSRAARACATVDRFSAVEHDPLTYNLPDRHRRLHRTYVSVPRSLDHVRFGSMSCRAILARQKRPSAAHMAVTRHRFAASRATNPKSHSPLAVFAARKLMTSGAFRPVRHRPISSVQPPIKLESARAAAGAAERSAAGGRGAFAPFDSMGVEFPVPKRVPGDCTSRVAPATSDNSRGCSIDNLANASDDWIDTGA